MKLDLQFRAKFEQILRTNKEVLQTESWQLVEKLVGSPYRNALLGGRNSNLSLPIDKEAFIASIEKTLQAADRIVFRYRGKLYDNSIYVDVIKAYGAGMPPTTEMRQKDRAVRKIVRAECMQDSIKTVMNY